MVLGNLTEGACYPFTYGTITLCGPPFQVIWLGCKFLTPRPSPHSGQVRPHYTDRTARAGFNVRFGLGCFPFARRY
jgi:hypothetical protein